MATTFEFQRFSNKMKGSLPDHAFLTYETELHLLLHCWKILSCPWAFGKGRYACRKFGKPRFRHYQCTLGLRFLCLHQMFHLGTFGIITWVNPSNGNVFLLEVFDLNTWENPSKIHDCFGCLKLCTVQHWWLERLCLCFELVLESLGKNPIAAGFWII